MPGWVSARELSPEEQKVQQGNDGTVGRFITNYPWVSTSTFTKGQPALGNHSHHSRNTHLIIKGKMKFSEVLDPRGSGGTKRRGERLDLEAGVEYQGDVKGTECIFVEGHKVLSPKTRDRFLVRGDIKWSVDQGHQGPVSAQVHREGDVTERVLRGEEVEDEGDYEEEYEYDDDDDEEEEEEEGEEEDNQVDEYEVEEYDDDK